MKKGMISFILALSLLIPLLSPLSILAKDESASPTTPETQTLPMAEEQFIESTPFTESLREDPLTEQTLPFAMTAADARLEGFVSRVKDAETNLHSAVFKNADGGLTLYHYSDPIKYIDANGVVRDKSNLLQTRTDGSFVTVSSDIQTTFPKHLKDGITMQKDEWQLRLAPAESLRFAGTLSADRTTVTYAKDAYTRYEYNLTSMGFKEDIVVSRYTGQTEYSFLLNTYGLTPVNEHGTWLLVDNDGIHRATLGEVIVFTADERNNTFGELRVEEITAGQTYRLTILLDADWLADVKTVYPITIDPALSYANNTTNIHDITVCQGTTYSAASGSLYVGRNADGDIRRALMCFPQLTFSAMTLPLQRFRCVILCANHGNYPCSAISTPVRHGAIAIR